MQRPCTLCLAGNASCLQYERLQTKEAATFLRIAAAHLQDTVYPLRSSSMGERVGSIFILTALILYEPHADQNLDA